ncbi:MAG: hypothetical protein ABI835_10725 [Chloroflexota bacterium]
MSEKPADPMIETVYQFISAYIGAHRYSPSLREISAECYIGRSTVLRYLDRLEAYGRIRRETGKARSITLRKDESVKS